MKRITIVGDYVDEIGAVICEALKRKPRFIITTGGLGPTFDDKTLEGVAKALNRELEVNEEALDMIRRKYETYFRKRITKSDLTPPRVKMATLPQGAKPLPNPVGTAPGVLLKASNTYVVTLPGVPPEMEGIFEDSVASLLRREAGKTAFFEKSIRVISIVESALAPLIDETMRDNPLVYIKSHVYVKDHPESEGKRPGIELHVSTTAENDKTAKERLESAAEQLLKLVKRNGGRIERQDSDK